MSENTIQEVSKPKVPRINEICFFLGVLNVAMSVYLITARPW